MKKTRQVLLWSLGFAFVLFLVHSLVFPVRGISQNKSLSLSQIEQLVRIHTPDNVVAGAIRSRGLDFTPTAKILQELQKRGAGQATLGAIRARMPIGTLEIDAAPGSEITLDGTERGLIDAQGRIVLSGLSAGPHELLVSKANYQTGEYSLTLRSNQYMRFPVKLTWAGGYLTIQVDQPGSAIQIPGLGEYSGSVSNLRCPARTYDITVTHPRLETQTRPVTVLAGRHALVEFHLVADPAWVANLLRNASDLRSGGDINGAVQKAKEILGVDPTNSAAHKSIYQTYLAGGSAALKKSNWWGAHNYFQTATQFEPGTPGAWGGLGTADLMLNQVPEMTSAWDNTLRLGGYVEFAVWHELGLHCENGMFRITASEVSFLNEKGEKRFAVPPAQIRMGRGLTIQAHSYFRLRVDRKNYNFDFVPFGVACQVLMVVQCPPQGVRQEQIVANYVSQAIPKLASGSLAPAPASAQTASGAPNVTLNPENSDTLRIDAVDPEPGTYLRRGQPVTFNIRLTYDLVSADSAFLSISTAQLRASPAGCHGTAGELTDAVHIPITRGGHEAQVSLTWSGDTGSATRGRVYGSGYVTFSPAFWVGKDGRLVRPLQRIKLFGKYPRFCYPFGY
jgi:hypothetical protein